MTRRAQRLPHGLYLVTPECDDDARLAARVGAALTGRPVLVQYRNKRAAAAQRLAQASQLRMLCRAAGVPFIVNDDVALALEVDADGVHIGRDDGAVDAVRARIGARLLGVSCYNDFARAEAAAAAGADYVAFGAMFASSTKPAAPPADIALLTRARAALPVGVVAIGGIALDNAPALVAAGASQLAVVSDVFDAPDPGARAAAYRALYAKD
ncbi:MAG: thiamine phosphate synthase [Rhodocyclaceae bacterium]|nr:thiamine phosphate synthase [Rhodocyclaceae bacterium]MCB1962519.1 thiamine phosphate synthase [Rhodocyclaceae bacterium]